MNAAMASANLLNGHSIGCILRQSHSEVDCHKLSLYATRASVLSDMDAATVLLVHYVYNTICIITAMLN